MADLFWLNDTQWAAIGPLLPLWGGKPRVDDRLVISGILHRFREGLRWRALPDAYGPRTTVCNRFNRWSERGVLQQVFLGPLRAGGGVLCGSIFLRLLRIAQSRHYSQWWTARRSGHTVRPLAQRGDTKA